MTVLERLKAAGYDPAMSLFPDRIGKAGSMECERIQIRTFFCRPRENEAAIGVTATAMTHFSDGSSVPGRLAAQPRCQRHALLRWRRGISLFRQRRY